MLVNTKPLAPITKVLDFSTTNGTTIYTVPTGRKCTFTYCYTSSGSFNLNGKSCQVNSAYISFMNSLVVVEGDVLKATGTTFLMVGTETDL